jgi:hypothetical protein
MSRPPRLRADNRPDIEIDGETWRPRKRFAAELKTSDKTAQRLNLRTLYFAGVAHVPVNESLRDLATRARRRNEPARRRAPGRRP